MITVRRAEDRGRTRIDWLDSRHTFSFGDYYDPRHEGFGALRVINDDRVAPGGGFPPHPHRDMEIVTYVLAGALRHEDSMGNGSVIRPGDVQRMSAGTGVTHSEWNASDQEPVHFLQIWIVPERRGIAPGYEQRAFNLDQPRLLASRDGRDGSVTVHQDADLWAARLSAGQRFEHALRPGRHAWLHLARGEAEMRNVPISEGDGVAVSEEQRVVVTAASAVEVLLFDLA